jgi:hypothetical protein
MFEQRYLYARDEREKLIEVVGHLLGPLSETFSPNFEQTTYLLT